MVKKRADIQFTMLYITILVQYSDGYCTMTWSGNVQVGEPFISMNWLGNVHISMQFGEHVIFMSWSENRLFRGTCRSVYQRSDKSRSAGKRCGDDIADGNKG